MAQLHIADFTTDDLLEGRICPTCGQHVKLYRRRPRRSLLLALERLERLDQQNHRAYEIKEILGEMMGRDGDFALFRHWGLIEPGRDPAHWSITSRGSRFVAGEIEIPRFALIYNNTCYGHSGEHFTFAALLSLES